MYQFILEAPTSEQRSILIFGILNVWQCEVGVVKTIIFLRENYVQDRFSLLLSSMPFYFIMINGDSNEANVLHIYEKY